MGFESAPFKPNKPPTCSVPPDYTTSQCTYTEIRLPYSQGSVLHCYIGNFHFTQLIQRQFSQVEGSSKTSSGAFLMAKK